MASPKQNLRNLPSVDKILNDKRVLRVIEQYSHNTVTEVARELLDKLRQSVSQGDPCPAFDNIVSAITSKILNLGSVGPRPVINATGVIIHTNLGRAPLSTEAIEAMRRTSEGFNNLEIDLESGKRGSRQVHTEELLCQITGAEDALVVNNNASAILLGLSALAKRKEVIVSRGQAVEIGGGFRVPDVMKQSGTRLVEVGTTNRTYIADYEKDITEKTAALLRVHSSNFKVVGFAEETDIEAMVGLGEMYNVPVLDDLGSGCLLDTTAFGMDAEPRVQESIAAGTALAFFSGDKLLGGPQAGIIVGQRHLIAKLKKHPLARAVRIDKNGLAALSATLIHYLKEEATEKVPVWRMISSPIKEIETRANNWAKQIGDLATTAKGESTVGGGSLPGSALSTRVVVIKMPRNVNVKNLAQKLRMSDMPVVGRIEQNKLILDPRSVLPEQDADLIKSLQQVLSNC